jgi:hypothetical protein
MATVERAYGLTAFFISEIGHTARVHHHEVRLLSGCRTPHAVFGKHCGHSGCFRKIQFTAECVEKRRTRAECTMVYHFSEYLLIIADISTASSTDVQADTGRHNNLCDISSATGADTAAIDSA